MKTGPLTAVLCVAGVTLALSGCTSIHEVGPPKVGDALSNGFPASKVSRTDLFDMAVQELKHKAVTIVESKVEEGIILGTIAPDRLGGMEGSSATTIVRRLASGDLLIRVDVTPEEQGEQRVHIAVRKSSVLLPGDPYVLQRDFIDGMKIRVARYLTGKAAAPKIMDSVDIPPSAPGKSLRRRGYAVLIGVEVYRDLPKVDFAKRDVETVKGYLIHVLGYPEENIITRTDERAGRSDFESYLEQWLERNVEKGSEVFVYYAGHGSPHPKSGQPFLVPFDGDPAFLDTTGYSLERLYQVLGKLPTERIVVVLDSCFSGLGGRSVVSKGSRPVGLTIENPKIPALDGKQFVIFAASQSNQISSAYQEKEHGLFTYFFLKALHGEADVNHDGSLSIAEVQQYVQSHVQRQSRRLNLEQVPQLTTSSSVKAESLSLF